MAHISKEQRDEIIRLYTEEHLSGPQIQRRLGIGQHRTIYRVLDKAGIKLPKVGLANPDKGPELAAEIVRLYVEEKLTGPEIKQKLGLRSVTTVYAALHRAGIERPSHGVQASIDAAQRSAQVVALWKSGVPFQQIRDSLGISVTHIYRILNDAGIKPSKSGRREAAIMAFTPKQELEIVNLFKQGVMRNAIAVRFRCSAHTVRNVLKRHGIDSHYNRRKFTPEEVEDILASHARGESPEEIGQRLEVRPGQVSSYLHSKLRGTNHGLKRVERFVDDNGYVSVLMPFDSPYRSMLAKGSGGYIFQHRLVMATHLGRPLLSTETVHHVNGKTGDNRIENLQLRHGAHGKGIVQRCMDCGSYNIEAVPLADPVDADGVPIRSALIARALAGKPVPVLALIKDFAKYYPEEMAAKLAAKQKTLES